MLSDNPVNIKYGETIRILEYDRNTPSHSYVDVTDYLWEVTGFVEGINLL